MGHVPFHLDFGQQAVDFGGSKLLLKKISGSLDFDAFAETAIIAFNTDECPVVDFSTLGGWIRFGVPIYEIKLSRAGADIKHRFGTRHIDVVTS